MKSTKGKQCPEWGLVEVTQRDPLFKDASECGDWCAKWSETYNTCIDYALKETQIQKLLKEYQQS